MYDKAGNMTTMPRPADPAIEYELKYDAWNRLVEISDGTDVLFMYEYDGLGRRIGSWDDNTDTTDQFYYNDQWQLLTVVNGEYEEPVRAIYHWHPFYVDALAVRMRSDDTHFFLQDANFNVTAAVDDSTNAVVERYAYTPYGEVTFLNASFSVIAGSAIDNQHLYTGRERDWGTGLQLNRHRYYAAHLGRWLNRDPIEYEGSPWNLYEYVGSRPAHRIDAHGLKEFGRILPPGAGIPGDWRGGIVTYDCTRKETINIQSHMQVACDTIADLIDLLTSCPNEVAEAFEGSAINPQLSTKEGQAETLSILTCLAGKCSNPIKLECECACDKDTIAYVRWVWFADRIHVCPVFFTSPREQEDGWKTMAHELGRLCGLGEEFTGTTKDVYRMNNAIEGLLRRHRYIESRCRPDSAIPLRSPPAN